MKDLEEPDDASLELLVAQVADEFSERLTRGEKPEIEEFARRYPRIAGVLRQVLPALEVVSRLPGRAAETPDPSGLPSHVTGCLGDYRILREVGRGGMGVVYEAEQVSLGRSVALKVLPWAAMMDRRQLQRFQNEARAAASLKHPNIVQVYAVACERAIHFYAMEYVDGQTLADVIVHLRHLSGLDGAPVPVAGEAAASLIDSLTTGQLARPKPVSDPDVPTAAYTRDPTPCPAAHTRRTPQPAISTERSTTSRVFFRSLAEIGVQVAEALDHAHQHGVIHRDVKPSNVILDNAGKPWVTDFGLARVETDVTLTTSGDLLGTVRYMSPEQALAKRVFVDHRTDIYSLGATLYELLTLQPVFSGQDRQELLRQIAFEEPSAPRRLNKSIPEELEIIILKAMAKNPSERYDTAQDLADDLKRFLEDRPIRARRPTTVQRVAKWSRRHKPVVWSAAILLTLATIGSTISSAIVLGAKRETDEAAALLQEQKAAAQRNADQAVKARKVADKARRLAERQKKLAEQQEQLTARAYLLANEQREIAEKRAATIQQQLYRSQVCLAGKELDRPIGVARAIELLETWYPDGGGSDLRDWEWFYLMSLCHLELRTLKGHTKAVWPVDWHPGGKRLATGSWDGTIKIWAVDTGRELMSINAHKDGVVFLRWSPDGNRIASAGADGGIAMWDGDTRQLVWQTKAHEGDPAIVGGATCVAWSPSGRYLATSGSDDMIHVLDSDSGEKTRTLQGHKGIVRSVSWSPNGRLIASGSNDGDVILWDAISGQSMGETGRHRSFVYCVDWAPNGNRLASSGRDTAVNIWTVGDNGLSPDPLTLTSHSDLVFTVRWSLDGKRLASASADGTVRIWDPQDGTMQKLLRGHTDYASSIAWDPSGSRLASTGNDARVKIWDATTSTVLPYGLEHQQAVLSVAWSPNDDCLASFTDNGVVHIWVSDKSNGPSAILPTVDKPSDNRDDRGNLWESRAHLAWAPDARSVACGMTGQEIRMVDVVSGNVTTPSQRDLGRAPMDWSPDGKRYASLTRHDQVGIWDASATSRLMVMGREKSYSPRLALSLCWARDGVRLAVCRGLQLQIWNVAEQQKTLDSQVAQSEIFSACWSPDGRRVAISCWDGTISIRDSATGVEERRLKGHVGVVTSVAWNPTGTRLASGSRDQTVIIWDTSTGEQLIRLSEHTGWVTCLAWSHDGKRLASASRDATVRIFDATAGYARKAQSQEQVNAE